MGFSTSATLLFDCCLASVRSCTACTKGPSYKLGTLKAMGAMQDLRSQQSYHSMAAWLPSGDARIVHSEPIRAGNLVFAVRIEGLGEEALKSL